MLHRLVEVLPTGVDASPARSVRWGMNVRPVGACLPCLWGLFCFYFFFLCVRGEPECFTWVWS
jgi:hypothetical protein